MKIIDIIFLKCKIVNSLKVFERLQLECVNGEHVKKTSNLYKKHTKCNGQRCWIYAYQMLLKIKEKDPKWKPKGSLKMTNSIKNPLFKKKQYAKTRQAWLQNPPLPSSLLATLATFAPTEALDCSSPASVKIVHLLV